jgi:hypothetical protein
MNLIEAIKLYCHLIQKHGNNIESRRIAYSSLFENEVPEEVISMIRNVVSNDGVLTDKTGSRFALTEISSS